MLPGHKQLMPEPELNLAMEQSIEGCGQLA